MRLLKGWIPEEVLQWFDYKYKSAACTWIEDNVLNVWWEIVVKRVPLNIAPNLITLIGFISVTLPFFYFIYLDPSFTQILPRWVYIITFIGAVSYQTCDGIDGKQAWRTKNGSALGELFDHGLDAGVCTVLVSLQYHNLGFGRTWISFIAILATMQTF